MALIKCPECGREISDRAKTCIHCGCPIEDIVSGGTVRIKMPNNVVSGWVGLMDSRTATVTDRTGHVLWQGRHGENASFEIEEPTEITIDLGRWANDVTGTVKPKCKYSLVLDMGVHMLATYSLTEVDNIDAD